MPASFWRLIYVEAVFCHTAAGTRLSSGGAFSRYDFGRAELGHRVEYGTSSRVRSCWGQPGDFPVVVAVCAWVGKSASMDGLRTQMLLCYPLIIGLPVIRLLRGVVVFTSRADARIDGGLFTKPLLVSPARDLLSVVPPGCFSTRCPGPARGFPTSLLRPGGHYTRALHWACVCCCVARLGVGRWGPGMSAFVLVPIFSFAPQLPRMVFVGVWLRSLPGGKRGLFHATWGRGAIHLHQARLSRHDRTPRAR